MNTATIDKGNVVADVMPGRFLRVPVGAGLTSLAEILEALPTANWFKASIITTAEGYRGLQIVECPVDQVPEVVLTDGALHPTRSVFTAPAGG